MNEKIKQLWRDALRSGRYKQGVGSLCRKREGDGPDEFCCLGVLCDLAFRAGVIEEPTKTIHGGISVLAYGPTNGEVAILPTKVAIWAGLPSNNPDVRVPAATISSHYAGRDRGEENNVDDGVPLGNSGDERWGMAGLNDAKWSFEEIASLLDHIEDFEVE